MKVLVVLKKTDCLRVDRRICLLRGLVLGDSLGSLRDGVLGKLTRKDESDSSLDLTGGDGGPLVVLSKTTGLCSNPSEDIISEGVEDAHGLRGDSNVGMDLLENLVDVEAVRLLPLSLPLLLLSLGGLHGRFSRILGRHGASSDVSVELSEDR